MAAHQVPPSLGFSRQEHWSGLPFPSPMRESEKWKGSRSVVSDSLQPHGPQPTRLLCPWDFPGKSTGVGCHCLLHFHVLSTVNNAVLNMDVQISLWDLVFNYLFRGGIVGSCGSFNVNFLRNLLTVFHSSCTILQPHWQYTRAPISHILTNTYYFCCFDNGHPLWRVDSLEKTLMLGRIGGRKRRGRQRMRWLDGITDLMDMSLSEFRELVMDRDVLVLWFMGSQRVRHDWATELNWIHVVLIYIFLIISAVEHLFMCLYIFFYEMSLQVLHPF